jgi:pimeloyl-ACP methyl ester carboxylesterase
MSGPDPRSPRLADVFVRFWSEGRCGTCDTGRYLARYFDWGDGPPVLFVHGLSDLARSFLPLISLLADRFRCVAYELPHGGRDHARPGRVTHESLAEDLTAVLDHLGWRRAAVFGSSFGSTIALRVMATRAERITHGILQGGFARRPLTRPQRRLAQVALRLPVRFADLPGRVKMLEEGDLPSFAHGPPEMWDFFVQNSGLTKAATVARRALVMDRLDLRPLLPRIHRPVLMIGGDADRLVPLANEREVLAGVAGSRRVEFAKCGHYPQYTHAVETAREVAAFLGEGVK